MPKTCARPSKACPVLDDHGIRVKDEMDKRIVIEARGIVNGKYLAKLLAAVIALPTGKEQLNGNQSTPERTW